MPCCGRIGHADLIDLEIAGMRRDENRDENWQALRLIFGLFY